MMTYSQIPGDMVVNAMVAAMAIHWNEKGQAVIHVTSSLQNPLSTATTLDIMYRYFSTNPQMGKNGRVIKAKRLLLTHKFECFRTYMFLKYKLPLEVKPLRHQELILQIYCGCKTYVLWCITLTMCPRSDKQMLHVVNPLLGGSFSRYYNKLNRSYKYFILLAKLYAPYGFFNAR